MPTTVFDSLICSTHTAICLHRRTVGAMLLALTTGGPLSAQDASSQLLSQFRVRGDTLVHLAGSGARPEIRYLLRPDTVIGISAAGVAISHVVSPMHARALRGIATAVETGTSLQPSMLIDFLRTAQTLFETAPLGMPEQSRGALSLLRMMAHDAERLERLVQDLLNGR